MDTTLTLTARVALTDPTGTRLPATSLTEALATAAAAPTGQHVVTVTGHHEGLTITPDTFTLDPDALWAQVLRRQPGELSWVALLPEDPSIN